MKTRIFALIISILCLSMLLVACDKPCEAHVDEDNDAVCDVCGEAVEKESESETETEAETETEGICEHKDADADKVCDACGKAVVVIVEQVPVEKETAAEMIVNPIPEDAKVEDYINTDLPKNEFISTGTELVGYIDREGQYVLKASGDDGARKFSIIDIATDNSKVIWTGTEDITDTQMVTYNVTLDDMWYIVETITQGIYEGVESPIFLMEKKTIEVYTYANDQIGETHTWTVEDYFDEFVEPSTDYFYDQECYVNFQDKVFVINPETNKIIYVSDPATLVKRPEFDEVCGNYGFVANYEYGEFEGIYVYDLTKWIDCVYSYVIPEKYENADWTVLQNGNILIWANVRLADAAVSYDYIEDGEKYDLVYTIVDVASKKAKDVEFGYAIDYAWSLDDSEGFVTEAATQHNLVVAYPVEGGYINSNETLYFIVDNGLNIVCKLDIVGAELVDDNTFIKEIVYNDGRYVYELVNVDGEHIDYLPADADWNYGYKVVDDEIWSYSNKVLFDFDDYDVCEYVSDRNYVLAVKAEEDFEGNVNYVYYTYIPGLAKKEIDSSKEDWGISQIYEFGYVVTYSEFNDMDETYTTVYELYNAKNELVVVLDSDIMYYEPVDGACIIWTYNYTCYVLK